MKNAQEKTSVGSKRGFGTLPKAITDGADEFYRLSDECFAQQVHEFTRNDPRLSLLFYATRQQYQESRSASSGI